MEVTMYKSLQELIDTVEDIKDLKYTVTTLTEDKFMIDRITEQSGYKIFRIEYNPDNDFDKGFDIDRGYRVFTFLHKKFLENAKSIMIPYIRVNDWYYCIKRAYVKLSDQLVKDLCEKIFRTMGRTQRSTAIFVGDKYMNLKIDTDNLKGIFIGFIIIEDACYQTRKCAIDILLNASKEWHTNMKLNGRSLSEYYGLSLASGINTDPFGFEYDIE